MSAAFLLVRASKLICALPVASVAETMRPMSVTPLRAVPGFVRGVSTIRGRATLVLDLTELLTGLPDPSVSRFVRLRLEARSAALAVGSVVGVRDLEPDATLPPLFDSMAGGAVERLGELDREVMVILRVSRIVPASVWDALSCEEAS